MAKTQVESIKNLIEKFQYQTVPPYEKLEESYFNLYMKQFEGYDDLIDAFRLENKFNNTMFFFFSAIVLFFLTGLFPYISIFDHSLSDFSVPSMIIGVISVIFACYQIIQISRRV